MRDASRDDVKTHTTLSVSGSLLLEAKRRGYCLSTVFEKALIKKMEEDNKFHKVVSSDQITPHEFLMFLLKKGYDKKKIAEVMKNEYPDIDFEEMAQSYDIPEHSEAVVLASITPRKKRKKEER